MSYFAVSYVVALAGFGTATSLEVLDRRQFSFSMLGQHRAASTLALIIEVGLMVFAFFRFPVATAILVDLVGFMAPGILMWVVPRAIRPGGVFIMFLIGVIAIVVHLTGHPPDTTQLSGSLNGEITVEGL